MSRFHLSQHPIELVVGFAVLLICGALPFYARIRIRKPNYRPLLPELEEGDEAEENSPLREVIVHERVHIEGTYIAPDGGQPRVNGDFVLKNGGGK